MPCVRHVTDSLLIRTQCDHVLCVFWYAWRWTYTTSLENNNGLACGEGFYDDDNIVGALPLFVCTYAPVTSSCRIPGIV